MLSYKILIGFSSLLAWITFLVFNRILKTTLLLDSAYFSDTIRVLLLCLNIPIIFIWITLGPGFGLAATLITCLSLLLHFGTLAALPIASLVIMGLVVYRLKRSFEDDAKSLKVDGEKAEEDLNLLKEETKSQKNDNFRIKNSIERTTRLQYIVEDYSRTLSEEDILGAIARNSFELFKDANRVLSYLVDTEKQELRLVRSKKRDIPYPIRAKKGDLYDRWVLKHGMPLLVQDIHRDFRFSLKNEEIDQGFISMINTPITSEHKILGVLRVDSNEKGKFTQSDLRFLDFIADLSGVSLQNALLYKKVEDLAVHDSLTGLYVHKYFVERLTDEVRRSLRNNTDMSLLLLDLDDFKAYNDEYGHNAGDLILRHIASTLESFAKSGDIAARYGGEEFTFLLLNSDKERASQIAEEIRKKVNETPLVLRRKKTTVTVSIGVASCPSEAKETREFLMLADSRLYRAKEKGKNRVCTKCPV